MLKPFLLTAGDTYYPCSGDLDWQGTYATKEEAERQITRSIEYGCEVFTINGISFDWYKIIDLRKWQ